MKKLLALSALAILPFAWASPALAATVIDQVQEAITSGHLGQIDVIAAKNPEDQGDIAIFLLQQAQNSSLSQSVRVKLFEAAAPFASQIPADDAGESATLITDMLSLAENSEFQKDHHKEAAGIIAAALSMSDQANILASDPGLHNLALADATNFPGGADDKILQDQVDLALQIGLSPPVGPRGIIDPSPH